jgi:hypothetical protein
VLVDVVDPIEEVAAEEVAEEEEAEEAEEGETQVEVMHPTDEEEDGDASDDDGDNEEEGMDTTNPGAVAVVGAHFALAGALHLERLYAVRRAVLDAVGALRTPASHVMAYICHPVCGGCSATVCRFLYRDGDLTANERMAIARHIAKRVAEDTAGKYTVDVHCYDGEKGNVTGTLAGSEPQTVAALKKLANTEAKAAATRATAEAKRLEEVVEPGEVPKAGTGAERRAVLAKSLLAQEIRSAAWPSRSRGNQTRGTATGPCVERHSTVSSRRKGTRARLRCWRCSMR